MKNGDFPKRDFNEIKQATLCFLLKDDSVLLAMKKRGFGVGKWNGVGGKVKEESIEDAARRETQEEISVKVGPLKKVAVLHFYFPDDPEKKDWNQDVHVFTAYSWLGEPKETEEMRPKWFKKDKLPFRDMWNDDPLWLPRVLAGKKLEGWLAFDDNNQVISSKIK